MAIIEYDNIMGKKQNKRQFINILSISINKRNKYICYTKYSHINSKG